MADVQFENNIIQVQNAIDNAINSVLEECAGELEAAVKRNTKVGKVNGGNTKNNWKHYLDNGTHTAYVGNPLETAIWLEFGTGEYADKGNGRKGGWYIPLGVGGMSENVAKAYGFPIIKGKNGKKFAFTKGMYPQRPFQKAYTAKKTTIIKIIQNKLKGL